MASSLDKLIQLEDGSWFIPAGTLLPGICPKCGLLIPGEDFTGKDWEDMCTCRNCGHEDTLRTFADLAEWRPLKKC